MTTYNEYEALICERIKSDNFNVSPLPKIDDLNNRPLEKPQVYVIFSGSAFTDRSNLGNFAANDTLSFELAICARTRESNNGIFAVAETIFTKLQNFRLPNTTEPITIVSFDYVDGIQNGWQYNIKITFPRIRIAQEETEHGTIKKIETNLSY